jgi:hypothetical protein
MSRSACRSGCRFPYTHPYIYLTCPHVKASFSAWPKLAPNCCGSQTGNSHRQRLLRQKWQQGAASNGPLSTTCVPALLLHTVSRRHPIVCQEILLTSDVSQKEQFAQELKNFGQILHRLVSSAMHVLYHDHLSRNGSSKRPKCYLH